MAKQTRTVVVDDLTGEEIPEEDAKTVRFSFEGSDYEIDLSASNATKLGSVLEQYIGAARRVRGSSSSKPKSNAPAGTSLQEIRDWAKANGHTVSDRGRVAASVVDAYNAAAK